MDLQSIHFKGPLGNPAAFSSIHWANDLLDLINYLQHEQLRRKEKLGASHPATKEAELYAKKAIDLYELLDMQFVNMRAKLILLNTELEGHVDTQIKAATWLEALEAKKKLLVTEKNTLNEHTQETGKPKE